MIWHADLHPDEVDGCVGIDLVSLLVADLVRRGLSVEGQPLEGAGQRGRHTGQVGRLLNLVLDAAPGAWLVAAGWRLQLAALLQRQQTLDVFAVAVRREALAVARRIRTGQVDVVDGPVTLG